MRLDSLFGIYAQYIVNNLLFILDKVTMKSFFSKGLGIQNPLDVVEEIIYMKQLILYLINPIKIGRLFFGTMYQRIKQLK